MGQQIECHRPRHGCRGTSNAVVFGLFFGVVWLGWLRAETPDARCREMAIVPRRRCPTVSSERTPVAASKRRLTSRRGQSTGAAATGWGRVWWKKANWVCRRLRGRIDIAKQQRCCRKQSKTKTKPKAKERTDFQQASRESNATCGGSCRLAGPQAFGVWATR